MNVWKKRDAAERRNFRLGFCAGLVMALFCASLLLIARVFG